MVPSFIVIGLGANATHALVVSQVVLSFALPVPMAALVLFTGRQDVMGAYKNRTSITVFATVSAVTVLSLNVILLLQTFGVAIPGLPG
jgi:manganese transport protein